MKESMKEREKEQEKYDIFISYRRSNGADSAKHLRDILVEKGYSVFFDTDCLRSGDFNVALLDVIKNCTDFIIILSPNALDRCVDEGDWVRLELACALENGKNIVPLMAQEFRFPDELPEDINGIRYKNGIDASIRYFQAMLADIIKFLHSKPEKRRNPNRLIAVAAVLAALALCAAVAVAAVYLLRPGQNGNQNAALPVPTPEPVEQDTQPTITKAPMITEAPAFTEAPVMTEAPKPTVTPKPTENPKAAQSITVTAQPASTAVIPPYTPISSYGGASYYGDYIPNGTAVIEDIDGNQYTAVANSLALSSGNTFYKGLFSQSHVKGLFSQSHVSFSNEYTFDDAISFSEIASFEKDKDMFHVVTHGGGTMDIILEKYKLRQYSLVFIAQEDTDTATILPMDSVKSLVTDWSRTPETNIKYCTVNLNSTSFRCPVAFLWFGINIGKNAPDIVITQDLKNFTEISCPVQYMQTITTESRPDASKEDAEITWLIITLQNGQVRECPGGYFFSVYLMGMDGALIRPDESLIREINFMEASAATPSQAPDVTPRPAAAWQGGNILMSDGEDIQNVWDAFALPVFGSEITRREIASVSVLSTTAGAPDTAWDVSRNENRSVLAWVEKNGELYDLYIAGEGGVTAPKNCRGLFCGYSKAEAISFGDALHTENTTSMDTMFGNMYRLKKLDLSGFCTSSVKEMDFMFLGCSKLEELDVSSFDTSNVETMSWMFLSCSALEELDLSSFDTSNVRFMSRMFNGCDSLRELDISGFDTSGVRLMESMFEGCAKLKTLRLGRFDTSSVSNKEKIFDRCDRLGQVFYGGTEADWQASSLAEELDPSVTVHFAAQ